MTSNWIELIIKLESKGNIINIKDILYVEYPLLENLIAIWSLLAKRGFEFFFNLAIITKTISNNTGKIDSIIEKIIIDILVRGIKVFESI